MSSRIRFGRALWGAGAVAIFLSPLWLHNDYLMRVVNQAGLAVVLAISLNLVAGFAGQLSLGQAAFYALGAYATAILDARYGWDFWATVPLALALAAAAGALLGAVTLRLSGHYLAVVTLAFAQIIILLATNWVGFTGGANGIIGIAAPHLGLVTIRNDRAYFYLIAALAALAIVTSVRIERSYLGRALMAVRDDEGAADGVGIHPFRWKLFAFTISAAFAGLAGSLFAGWLRVVSPDSFQIGASITLLVMVVIGGLGSTAGAASGAVLITFLPEILRFMKDYYLLTYGLMLALVVMFLPGGIRSLRLLRRLVTSRRDFDRPAEAR